jgi:methionyl-tRNA formyltransferase
MKKISKTIVFFGTDESSLIALQGLIESGYNIAAIVTKPDSKSGRGQLLTAPSVKKLALKHNITVWQPSKISDINDNINALGLDMIGVLVSFGKIIPESTINLFNQGIINVHPSLLPLYRGPSPIESAIENGDEITGVSIMKLTAEMDAGPVYDQIIHKLSGHETRSELYKTLFHAGTTKLINLLPSIIDGSLQPTPQNNDQATYCNLFNKDDAWLKPNEVTATRAECLVRAHLGFPKTKLSVLDNTVIITKAHVANEQKTSLDILCQDNKYLSIDELIAPSGRTMSAQDFINGYAN